MTKPQQPRKLAPRRFFTDEERELILAVYADTPTKDIATRLGRDIDSIYRFAIRLGLRKSAAYMASPAACRLRRENHPGISTQFKKGHIPQNKGLRRPGWFVGRMRETQFKKGGRSQNWKPVGSIARDADGYLRIKIAERVNGEPRGWHSSVWPALHRYNWEKVHGPIPPGHIVVFKNGDRTNCDPSNLELITIAENMRRNTVHNLPKELVDVIMLKGAVKRRIRQREKKTRAQKHHAGPAQPSV